MGEGVLRPVLVDGTLGKAVIAGWIVARVECRLANRSTACASNPVAVNSRSETVAMRLGPDYIPRSWQSKRPPTSISRSSSTRPWPTPGTRRSAPPPDSPWRSFLNWFRAKGTISAGVVEGLNGVVKLTTRKAFGFRTAKGIEIALFHVLGKLPEPESTHRFC
ncbi:MAG: transposase [Planctomycetes bacterium]|nr:transposase [Planctomycetota bacterium]